jgi:hypothetical protein
MWLVRRAGIHEKIPSQLYKIRVLYNSQVSFPVQATGRTHFVNKYVVIRT